jgi:hypothetical protein
MTADFQKIEKDLFLRAHFAAEVASKPWVDKILEVRKYEIP